MSSQKISKPIMNSINRVAQIKSAPYIILFLAILSFWFYWSQIRVINIRRTCYLEVFTPSPENAKWNRGKVWRILYPVYDPAKGDRIKYGFWGWGYPPADNEIINYKQCLTWRGLTSNLLDIN